jgi:hypothetical protein
MDYNGCISIIQGYLENSPLVILGSGSSLKYGLPSMKQLATEISNPAYNIVDPAFDDFCLKLDSQGLEMALDSSNLLPETQDRIREIVWQTVNRSDLLWLEKLKTENIEFAVVDLLKKVIQPAQNTATVVTTNYDRIAEYAADLIGATAITGFEGTLIRKLEIEDRRIHVKRIRARERFISIWKVHGSLDWFLDDKDNVSSFPLSSAYPPSYTPLIIPPGKDKYSATHNEPYRSIIGKADEAFLSASSYLCIGYGFNDEHIQPKLLAETQKGKPIVVLTHKMTEACKRHIIDANVKKYAILEFCDDNHTTVYGNGWTNTYDGCFWNLDGFMKIW